MINLILINNINNNIISDQFDYTFAYDIDNPLLLCPI
jgi:hypothetical protein